MTTHIDALPPVPTRADPVNFAARADALLLALVAFVAQANTLTDEVNANATAAAAAAVTAANAPGTSGTSTTANSVALGAQNPVTQAGKNFVPGMWVTIARTSDATKWMVGPVTAYNSGTGALSVNVQICNGAGSGPYTDWTISISPPVFFPAATAAQIWAGTSSAVANTPAALFAAAALIALADSGTITPDFNTGFNFSVTLGGNRTLANPTNLKVGQSGVIAVAQDATGSRSLAFGSYWKFPGGAPSLSTTASATDLISYIVLTPTLILCTLMKAFG